MVATSRVVVCRGWLRDRGAQCTMSPTDASGRPQTTDASRTWIMRVSLLLVPALVLGRQAVPAWLVVGSRVKKVAMSVKPSG
jgi:hypothetical protein